MRSRDEEYEKWQETLFEELEGVVDIEFSFPYALVEFADGTTKEYEFESPRVYRQDREVRL